MDEQQQENWMHEIRSLGPVIEKAEFEVFKTDADVKKIFAMLKTRALAEGHKTNTAQETYAENQDELYQARLKVGVAKGFLSSCKVQWKALEIGFEEWRTKMVNAREERKRYGA